MGKCQAGGRASNDIACALSHPGLTAAAIVRQALPPGPNRTARMSTRARLETKDAPRKQPTPQDTSEAAPPSNARNNARISYETNETQGADESETSRTNSGPRIPQSDFKVVGRWSLVVGRWTLDAGRWALAVDC